MCVKHVHCESYWNMHKVCFYLNVTELNVYITERNTQVNHSVLRLVFSDSISILFDLQYVGCQVMGFKR